MQAKKKRPHVTVTTNVCPDKMPDAWKTRPRRNVDVKREVVLYRHAFGWEDAEFYNHVHDDVRSWVEM